MAAVGRQRGVHLMAKKNAWRNLRLIGKKWHGRFEYKKEKVYFVIGFREEMSPGQAQKKFKAIRRDYIRTVEVGPKFKNSRHGRSVDDGALLNTNQKDRQAMRTGAYAELAVAADLLRQSFEVFRPFSNGCEYDLLAVSNEHFIRIEVK